MSSSKLLESLSKLLARESKVTSELYHTVDGLLLDGYVLRPSGHAVICTRDEVIICSILKPAWS